MGEKKEKKKDKEKEKKDKEKEEEKATVRSAPDGSDNNSSSVAINKTSRKNLTKRKDRKNTEDIVWGKPQIKSHMLGLKEQNIA